MVCIITVHPSAEETPTEVLTQWIDPSGSQLAPSGNLQVYSESDSPQFRLTAEFSSLASYNSYSGSYVCSSHVQPNSSHPFVVSSEVVNASTTFTVGKMNYVSVTDVYMIIINLPYLNLGKNSSCFTLFLATC